MDYLIDTNICIYVMNRRPPEVIQRFRRLEVGQAGISSITVSELQYGVWKSQNPERNTKRLQEFLLPFEILPYDEDASRHYGRIRARLEREGQTIGPLDLLIAAQALSRNLVLITNNTRELQRVEALKVENWVE